MSNNTDLTWIQKGRELDVEAIDGGRASNEFTLGPSEITDPEEMPVNTRAVDDAAETEERLTIIQQYIPYARAAFSDRDLTYPFCASDSGDSLVVLPGAAMRELAKKVAHLSRIISTTGTPSKEFESRGFQALHHFLGGIGACVGATRVGNTGPQRAVEEFRQLLSEHEKGGHHDPYPKNGDLGADGFIIIGRPWIGPLVYYQSKNTPLNLRDFPSEFSRVSGIVKAWFGRSMHNQRPVIPVYASNTLLTISSREAIYESQGLTAVMIIDAADILRAEENRPVASRCTML